MYPLFLICCVALVLLSPLALELWLTTHEHRAQRRRINKLAKAKAPTIAWASPRLR